MGKYKRIEIELTPMLLKKVLEHVKDATPQDIETIIANFIDLSYCDHTLTLEDFELVTKKST
jgi:hypothetical protein